MEADRRTEARERAVALLYEAEIKSMTPAEVLADLPVAPDALAGELVDGVGRLGGDIDRLLREHARGWSLERMPAVDRAILRVGVYELLARGDVPTAVVIDEAVELAKRLSTDDSGRFVNGMLSAISEATRAS